MRPLTRAEVLSSVAELVNSRLDTSEFGTFTITVKMKYGQPVAVTEEVGAAFMPVPLELLTVEKLW